MKVGVSKLKFNQKKGGGLRCSKSQFLTPKMRHSYTSEFKNLQKIKTTIQNFESRCFEIEIKSEKWKYSQIFKYLIFNPENRAPSYHKIKKSLKNQNHNQNFENRYIQIKNYKELFLRNNMGQKRLSN